MAASDAWQEVAELECWKALLAGVIVHIAMLKEQVYRGADSETIYEQVLAAERDAQRLCLRLTAAWADAQRGARDK